MRDQEQKQKRTFGSAIRWSIEQGSLEYAIDQKTLAGRLRKNGEIPGDDKKYSTAQICGAVFGDLEAEKTRLTRSQADMAEVELAEKRGEVVQVQSAFLTVSNMLFAVRRVITMSGLSPEAQDAIFKELQGLKVEDFVTETKKENE